MTSTAPAEATAAAACSIDSGQFLTFILGNEEYGVDILRVQEIKGWDSATEIPNAPEYVRGVINLRGTIVPIIDLRRRFNLASAEYGKTTVVVVLKVHAAAGTTRTMGFVVDAVSDVYNVAAEQIQPPPDVGDVTDAAFVKALATVNEKMVILLDVDRLGGGELAGPTHTAH
ncbi:MAG: chemotaxis protein CheW [Gammaproteobacteria bacterium]